MLQLRPPGSMLAALLALLVVPWAGACGSKTQANPDGGDGRTITPDALAGGRHAFDVVAVLRADGASNLPPTNIFTMVLDVDALRVIAGGNGRGAIVGVTTSDGRTFHSAGPFAVGGDGTSCGGTTDVRYDSFEVTVANGSLTGTATGSADISCGDCSFMLPFGATLTGTADVTPPTLHGAGFTPANPFDPVSLATSEPLPAGSTARLVADDGVAVDLIPLVVDGSEPLVVGFTKPNVVLRAGQGYTISVDGLVDFAGQTDPSGTPLRLVAFPDAPAVAEDGFESATGSVLGGAMVMTAGPLPAIAGNTSLYIGGMGAPALDAPNGRSLMVRLARQAGDTKLRYSYRVVSAQTQPYFSGTLRVGSEGASPGTPVYTLGEGTAVSELITVAGMTAYAGPVTTAETPLPADATDRVLLVITPNVFSCGPRPFASGGLLIDDLRLE